MANGYSAGNLYLNIDSFATDTLKNLDAVIDRLNIINKGLGNISKVTKATQIATKSTKNNKTNKTFSNLLNASKMAIILNIVRRIGSGMANIVKSGSDFGETLNLWKVAMGNEFLPQATEFVNKLNEAYGISKATLMNSQAIFKNMLGSLGQISDETAYQLSEGITQMALDYASLYNVKFEEAMTKFQAALAGQVRPIRSVAGYDITENTLFQLYQTLGGEKTMRQLSRTEKQLLAIYAVFEQMGRSGATGDLERTINSFANQSRVFADSWNEVKTYAGLVVTRLLEQYNVMQYINAVLIFMSRLLEGLATSLDTGLGNSGDVFGDMENSINSVTDATEDLKSSLLDFDKFRALDQSSGDNPLGIDQTILDAMKQYDSILENANLEARKLADTWLEALGYVDANNDGILDMSDELNVLKNDILPIIQNIFKNLIGSIASFTPETIDLLISVLRVIESLTEIGSYVTQVVASLLELLSPIGSIIKRITELFPGITKFFQYIIGILSLGYDLVIKMIGSVLELLNSLIHWDWNSLGEKLKNIWSDWTVEKIFSTNVTNYSSGGMPDKGTIFRAGEAGAEIVYNTPSGQSGVANVRQIEQAMYNALARYGEQNGGTIVVQAYLDGEKVYENTTARAKSQGFVWAKA